MLRNIPNRLDLNQLKQIVDQTSAGHYDFMYLRIGMLVRQLDHRVADCFQILPMLATLAMHSSTSSMYVLAFAFLL